MPIYCLNNVNLLGDEQNTSPYSSYGSYSNPSEMDITASGDINVVVSDGNKFVFNNGGTYDSTVAYGLGKGTYYLRNEGSSHPIALLNNGSSRDISSAISYTGNAAYKLTKTVTGTDNDGDYDFYYGNIAITVNSNFANVSYYCYNHGYMGGQLNFVYGSASGAYCQNTYYPHAVKSVIRPASHQLGAGDFTTIQSWEDYVDGEPNPYQWGECYSGGNLGVFNISGWSSTPTASGYPRIYANEKEYHAGQFNRGPIISSTTGSNSCSVNYSRIEGLVSSRSIVIDAENAGYCQIKDCAVLSDAGGFKILNNNSAINSSGNSITNCISICTETTPGTNDIGFELGGTDMAGGRVDVDCVNCTSYNNYYGFFINNSKTPGHGGGGNLTIVNCLSSDSSSVDFNYIQGGDGYVINKRNCSKDQSSLDFITAIVDEFSISQADEYTTDGFRGVTSAKLFVNPENNYNGDFRLKSTAPIIGSGDPSVGRYTEGAEEIAYYANATLGGSVFLETDIVKNYRGEELWDIGAYEYYSNPYLTSTLFCAGNTDPDAVAFATLYVKGKARGDINLYTLGPVQSTDSFNLFTKAKTLKGKNKKFDLFIYGNVNNAMSLFARGITISTSTMNLYTINYLPKEYTDLFVYGGPAITIPVEADLSFSGSSAKPGDLIVAVNDNISLFIGQSPAHNIPSVMEFMVTGTSPFFPKEYRHLRRVDVDSDGYFPAGNGVFLYTEPEHNCSILKTHYAFNNDGTDSAGSLDLSEHNTPVYSSTGNRIGSHCVHFDGTYASFSRTYDFKFDSGTDGIAISFWVNKSVEQTTFPGEGDYKYPAGMITRAKVPYDANVGTSIQNIIGDWGIFTNPKTEAGQNDLLFYTHVMDIDQESTLTTEGLALQTNQWYFVMYWIDTEGKSSYIRTRKWEDYYGFEAETKVGQSWETRTLAEAHPGTSTGQPLYIGLNGSNSQIPGNLYGDRWLLDDVRFSKTICSKNAMEQEFNSLYLQYREDYFISGNLTLHIIGHDENI